MFAFGPQVMLLLATMQTCIICSHILAQNKSQSNHMITCSYLTATKIYLCILQGFYSLFNILSWSVNIMHLVLLRTISTCTLLINAYVKQNKYILHGYVASGLISSSVSYSPIKRLTPVFQFMWLIPCIAHKFKKNPRKLVEFNDPNIKKYSL